MNKIKILRTEYGLSQQELARCIHVHQTAVSQWEIGKTNPDIHQAGALADFFNVSIDYLLGRTEEGKKPRPADGIQSSRIDRGTVMTGTRQDCVFSKEEMELIRIYRDLDVRSRHRLLDCAFELEQKDEPE